MLKIYSLACRSPFFHIVGAVSSGRRACVMQNQKTTSKRQNSVYKVAYWLALIASRGSWSCQNSYGFQWFEAWRFCWRNFRPLGTMPELLLMLPLSVLILTYEGIQIDYYFNKIKNHFIGLHLSKEIFVRQNSYLA